MLSNEQIKRLLYGYMKKNGLLNILKGCYEETFSVKTKAIVSLFYLLTDNNKCHQVDEFKGIWCT
jgi:transcriptional antiterminator